MDTWPCHIDRFERQYNKAFVGNPFFGADVDNRIHKQVQVFLHSCNAMSLDNVETGALS